MCKRRESKWPDMEFADIYTTALLTRTYCANHKLSVSQNEIAYTGRYDEYRDDKLCIGVDAPSDWGVVWTRVPIGCR